MAILHPMHLALVALVVLLIFGPKKLPELARGVGDAMKELQKSLHPANEPETAASTAACVPAPPAAAAAAPPDASAAAGPASQLRSQQSVQEESL